jgi:hypothetical protein
MKKPNLIFASYILFVFISFSCKKNNVGPEGPAGASYDITKGWTSKEGFIKGTATGNRADGTSFTYDNLDLEGIYSSTNNRYIIYSPTQTTISVSKLYAGDGNQFYNGSISFSFDVTSLDDLSSPIITDYNVSLKKDLGGNAYHSIYVDKSNEANYSGTPCSVSNLSYNSTTGILTGNFNIDMNDGLVIFSIANGTFSTKLSQVILRTAS